MYTVLPYSALQVQIYNLTIANQNVASMCGTGDKNAVRSHIKRGNLHPGQKTQVCNVTVHLFTIIGGLW